MKRGNKSPDEIRQYIKDNHMSLTVSELAEANNISGAAMSVYCSKMGITPITKRGKTIQFIKDHPTWRAEKISEALNCSAGSIKNLISQENLRPKYPTVAIQTFLKKNTPQTDLPKEIIEEITKGREEKLRKIGGEFGVLKSSGTRGFKDKYNQTHSPYGLADQLRGVETTKEPQTFYSEIVRL